MIYKIWEQTLMEKNVFDELKWRGLVYDYTEGLPEVLTKETAKEDVRVASIMA